MELKKVRGGYSDLTVNRILTHIKTLQYARVSDQELAEALDDR